MYVLNVTYNMKPGMRDEFLKAVLTPEVMGECRKENGCLQYDYFSQADNPDKVLLIEKWTGKDAQQVHQTQPHMALIRAAKVAFVEDTILEAYEA